jgi:hypothetical protein
MLGVKKDHAKDFLLEIAELMSQEVQDVLRAFDEASLLRLLVQPALSNLSNGPQGGDLGRSQAFDTA